MGQPGTMRRRVALLAALTMVSAATAAVPAADPAPVISIKALLFNNRTGGFSEDVIADTSRLGNVPAGDYGSTSTLVVVRVVFAKDRDYPSARVRLVATAGEQRARVVLDRTVRIGAIGADNTTHVGFWLTDTGCTPLKLVATLATPGPAVTGRATLPFTCYE